MGINNIEVLKDQEPQHVIGRRKTTEFFLSNEEVFWIECNGHVISHKLFNRNTDPKEIDSWAKTILEEHKPECPINKE